MNQMNNNDLTRLAEQFKGRADDCGRLARAVLDDRERQAGEAVSFEDYEFQRKKADLATATVYQFHYAMKDAGWHPGRTDDNLCDIIRTKAAELKALQDAASLPAPQAVQAEDQRCLPDGLRYKMPSLVLSGYQLKEALGFLAPDDTDEQLEQQVCIAERDNVRDEDGDETLPAGLFIWLEEYPEEGLMPLGGAAPTHETSEPDWPDVSPAGLRAMAEIAAPNNGRVFLAAADRIERAEARPYDDALGRMCAAGLAMGGPGHAGKAEQAEAPSDVDMASPEYRAGWNAGVDVMTKAMLRATQPTASNAGEQS